SSDASVVPGQRMPSAHDDAAPVAALDATTTSADAAQTLAWSRAEMPPPWQDSWYQTCEGPAAEQPPSTDVVPPSAAVTVDGLRESARRSAGASPIGKTSTTTPKRVIPTMPGPSPSTTSTWSPASSTRACTAVCDAKHIEPQSAAAVHDASTKPI